MKKVAIFMSILLFSLVLSSCHGQSYGILSYQEGDIYAECSLNGEYKLAVSKKEGVRSLQFLYPEELSSVSFIETDGKIIGRAGEVEIPFDSDNLSGVSAILAMFSLEESSLASATPDKSSACMEFNNTLGTYKITIGENDLPKRIEIFSDKYEFDIVIEAIKLN
ncbi:MAG: hypothetical protein IJ437_01725 [Clostridia bacterium]|nr:hypothetical protein [Clostridia bacterium]